MKWQNNRQHRTTTPVYDQDPLLYLLWTVFPSFLSFSRCCVCFSNISFFLFTGAAVDCRLLSSKKLPLVEQFPKKSKSWTLLEGFRERLQFDGHFHRVLLLGGREDSLETWPPPQVSSLCSPKTCRVEIVGSENEGKFLSVQFSVTIYDQIQHVKSSKNDAGRLFFHERFSLNNVSGVLLIELTMTARW